MFAPPMYSLCRFRDFLLCVSWCKQPRILPCVTDFPDRLDCCHCAVHGRFARMNVIMRSSRHIGVPEQTCDCRGIHTLLDGARRERVPNVVKPNVRQFQAVQYITPIVAQVFRVEHAAHRAVNDEIRPVRRPLEQRAKPLPLHGQPFRAAVRVNGCRNRIYRHNAVCNRTFAAECACAYCRCNARNRSASPPARHMLQATAQSINTKINLIVHPSKYRIFLSDFLRNPLTHKWAGYIHFPDLRRKHQKRNQSKYCLERPRHSGYNHFRSAMLLLHDSSSLRHRHQPRHIHLQTCQRQRFLRSLIGKCRYEMFHIQVFRQSQGRNTHSF